MKHDVLGCIAFHAFYTILAVVAFLVVAPFVIVGATICVPIWIAGVVLEVLIAPFASRFLKVFGGIFKSFVVLFFMAVIVNSRETRDEPVPT
jgi:hypothetical protein